MTYSEKLKDPRWQKKSGIYKLIINEHLYIGSAVDLPTRLRCHLNDLIGNRHVNRHLQRAFNKYNSIDFDVIELVSDTLSLINREQYFIDTLHPRYNIASKAGSMLGFKHSDETKRRLSTMQIGRIISDETKRKMSASKTGMTFSEAHRVNIGLAKIGEKNPFYKAGKNHPQYGVPKSKVTRQRISDTSKRLGSHKGEKNKASKRGVFFDAETGGNYLFFSLKPLCEYLGINYKGICSAIRQDKFYMDRFYVTYYPVPHKTLFTNITPVNG